MVAVVMVVAFFQSVLSYSLVDGCCLDVVVVFVVVVVCFSGPSMSTSQKIPATAHHQALCKANFRPRFVSTSCRIEL